MSVKQNWNTELYEAQHSFVWQFGEGVVDLLKPQPSERILDLGCGTGQLTDRIAQAGANVIGLDASPDMIGQARQNYPKLEFVLLDAARMQYSNEFDAVFSNAALHWMLDSRAVAEAIAKALKPDGRLVAEFGGKGNISQIDAAIAAVVPTYGGNARQTHRTYFPSIAEYASVLDQAGLETQMAILFDRPTPLEGEEGMANWLRQFAAYHFQPLSPADRPKAMADVVEKLRPLRCRDGAWSVDYRRLRLIAIKL